MEEYYIYLRKSRADKEAEMRGEGETLARHQKILLDLAARKKLNVTRIFKEIVSGETISERPQVQNLLSEIEKGRCAGVLVMEVERLARGDTKDQGVIAETFKYSNTRIITPGKVYDPNNEFDEEYFEFGLFMSRREYKTINRRIQRGRIASVEEGKFISSVAPYGYTKVRVPNGNGYTLAIDPQRADVVRMIYQWYTEGIVESDGSRQTMGATLICRKLDSMHIKPMVNDTWSKASVMDILKNPVYIGKIRWSYRKTIRKMVNGSVVKTRPDNKEDYLLVDGIHPPIISAATFDKARKISQANRRRPIKSSAILQNPLSGIVYCKKCGQLMTRLGPNNKNPYSTLKCSNRYCDNISSPVYLVEDKLLYFLEKWLENYQLEWDHCDDIFPSESEFKVKEQAINSARSELQSLKDQLNNTYTFVEKGVYTVDVFMERNKSLTDQIQAVEKDICSLEEGYNNALAVQRSRSEFVPKVKNIIEVYKTISNAELKNDMLKDVLERVEYRKDTPNTRGKRDNANFVLDIYPKIPKK